jgi:hypothetical protein
MITFMTARVTHVIKVNIFKVKVTKNDKICGYFPDIAQSISSKCIFIMPTSLPKASIMGAFCDNVALV